MQASIFLKYSPVNAQCESGAGFSKHIWLIWSNGTLHAGLYGLPLPVFSLLLVVTSHLVLEVFARQLLLSGIVFPLTSILAKLSQHSAPTSKISSFPLSLCHCVATHLSASDLFSTMALYKSIYLLVFIVCCCLIQFVCV